MKKLLIILLAVILVGVGVYLFARRPSPSVVAPKDAAQPQGIQQTGGTQAVQPANGGETAIGKSVEGREITAYHYGNGDTELLFVGGMHGGYSWNTALVAYEMMEYLKANAAVIPSALTVTVIPVLNPDGLAKVVGTHLRFTKADVSSSQTVRVSGRFNANKVDLNRNFDCEWQSVGLWQTTKVSGGSTAFSEPESQAFRAYVEAKRPAAVVVWFSSAGGVFSSECGGGILPQTRALTSIYAKASGYPEYESFDFYETTGDMVNWLAKNNIPAISVLLTTHEETEWSKNRKGIEAVFQHYGK